jgi:PIN domain nuclease of toxin-antitoxin system
MKLLLDTHLLLWSADRPEQLSGIARTLLLDPENTLFFSAAALWEISIKSALRRKDFPVDPSLFRRNLLDNGYIEMPITSEHAVAVFNLPPIHRDPFDRILIAQAIFEGLLLLTHDRKVAQYPGPIRKV